MAIIPQRSLFRWEEVERLGDLERLRLVLSALPDEPLMGVLEKERGHGRDDYPIRAMWNSLVAGVVFQHPSGGGAASGVAAEPAAAVGVRVRPAEGGGGGAAGLGVYALPAVAGAALDPH